MDDRAPDEATLRFRREFRSWIERLEPHALVGLSEDEARNRVLAAGGVFEAHEPDAVLAMDLDVRRVRAAVVAGKVIDASVG